LEARLEANPPPRLTWTTAGRQIHPSGRHDIRYDNGIVVLLINNVQPQDAGEYQLRASNELGEVSCKTVLNIRRESTDQSTSHSGVSASWGGTNHRMRWVWEGTEANWWRLIAE